MTNYIQDRYFDWLMEIVCCDKYSGYRKKYDILLKHLLLREFHWSIPKDENRYLDGLELRDDFLYENPDLINDFALYFDESSCSVLEVMIALAQRCETIMSNDAFGNRTSRWFWDMITSLNLRDMTNQYFEKEYVNETIFRCLDHEYEPDGRGGLFTIPDIDTDLRYVEIWYQMCWYLNYIIDNEGE